MQTRTLAEFAIVVAAIAGTAALLRSAYSTHESVPDIEAERHDMATYSTKELLGLARTESVCREIFKREGVDLPTLNAALIRVSTISKKSRFELLHQLIASLPATASHAQVANVCTLIGTVSDEEQRELVGIVQTLLAAPETSQSACRASFAIWLSVDRDVETVFVRAAEYGETDTLIASLPLVDSIEMRRSFYDQLKPILAQARNDQSSDEQQFAAVPSFSHEITSDSPALSESLSHSGKFETLKVAIAVCVQLEGRESEKAADLIRLLSDRELRPTVIDSLARLSVKHLPQDQLGFVASEVIAFIAEQPIGNRSQSEMASALQLAHRIGDRLPKDKQARLRKRLTELLDD